MTGNKILDSIILSINFFGCLIGLSFFTYTEFIYKRPIPDSAVELNKLKQEARDKKAENSYEMDKVIVNLHSRNTLLRYLEVEVHLFPTKQEYMGLFEKNKVFIYDSLIDISSNITPEELNSVTGKILFEGEIKKRLHQKFGKPLVKNIYFSKFIVQ